MTSSPRSQARVAVAVVRDRTGDAGTAGAAGPAHAVGAAAVAQGRPGDATGPFDRLTPPEAQAAARLRPACGLRPAFVSSCGAPVWRCRVPAAERVRASDLAALGLGRVWDLRSESERASNPAARVPRACLSVPDGPLYVVGRTHLGFAAERRARPVPSDREGNGSAGAPAACASGVAGGAGAPAEAAPGRAGAPGAAPDLGPGEIPPVPGRADAELARQLRDGHLGRQQPGERMDDIYRSMGRHAAVLLPVVSALVDADAPTLVYCSSGKDRTGMACYCAQRVLGASREEAIESYLQTNAVNARVNSDDLARLAERGVPPWRLEVALSLFLAKEEYVDAFEDEVARLYGSFAAYLRACEGGGA